MVQKLITQIGSFVNSLGRPKYGVGKLTIQSEKTTDEVAKILDGISYDLKEQVMRCFAFNEYEYSKYECSPITYQRVKEVVLQEGGIFDVVEHPSGEENVYWFRWGTHVRKGKVDDLIEILGKIGLEGTYKSYV